MRNFRGDRSTGQSLTEIFRTHTATTYPSSKPPGHQHWVSLNRNRQSANWSVNESEEVKLAHLVLRRRRRCSNEQLPQRQHPWHWQGVDCSRLGEGGEAVLRQAAHAREVQLDWQAPERRVRRAARRSAWLNLQEVLDQIVAVRRLPGRGHSVGPRCRGESRDGAEAGDGSWAARQGKQVGDRGRRASLPQASLEVEEVLRFEGGSSRRGRCASRGGKGRVPAGADEHLPEEPREVVLGA